MTHGILTPRLNGALERLRSEAEHYFGDPDTIIEPLGLDDREAALVLRARVRAAQGVRHIFVKVFKPRGSSPEACQSARERVAHDFATTRQVHQALGGYAELSAAWPIACFPDELVLVTEEAPGERFDLLLERTAVWQPSDDTVGELCRVASRIGRWLSAFQRVCRSNRRITLEAMREYLDVRLRRLVANPKAAFSQSDRTAVLAHFDATCRNVADDDLAEVLVHGDLAPSNILVNKEEIIVIDFAMATTGGLYMDVARLYTQLDFLKAKPKFRPHVIERLQTALLDGFDPALRPTHPLFRLFELQHVICHTANLSLNPAPPMARLFNLYQLQRHRRWLRRRAA